MNQSSSPRLLISTDSLVSSPAFILSLKPPSFSNISFFNIKLPPARDLTLPVNRDEFNFHPLSTHEGFSLSKHPPPTAPTFSLLRKSTADDNQVAEATQSPSMNATISPFALLTPKFLTAPTFTPSLTSTMSA